MSYTGNNPKFDSTILKDLLSTVVTNPPAAYYKRLVRYGKSYLRSVLGEESQVAKGEGRNYCLSPSVYIPAASSAALGWFNSGGTVSNITAALPRDSDLSAVQFVSTTTGDYLRYRFKADDADVTTLRRLQIIFSQIAVFGDYKLEVYSGADAALSSPLLITVQSIYTNSSGITNLPTATTDIISNFDPSSKQFYEIRWTALRTASTTLKMSGVNIGTGSSSQTAPIAQVPWAPSFSAGFGGSGAVGEGLKARKVGEYLHLSGRIVLGTVTAAPGTISLPSGLTAGVTTTILVGKFSTSKATANSVKTGCFFVTPGSSVITLSIDDYTNNNQSFAALNISPTFATGETIGIDGELIIPINEWVGTGSVGTLNPIAQSPTRAGTIEAFAGATTPQGWLNCDGTAYLRDQYPQLFAQIGTTWDTATNPLTGSPYASPGGSNFRVPDLRGAFLRGAGGPNAAGITTALAGYQARQTKLPTTAFYITGGNLPSGFTGTTPTNPGNGLGVQYGNGGANQTTWNGNAILNGGGDAETRPDNQGVKMIIKAWDESFNLAGGVIANQTTAGFVSNQVSPTNLIASDLGSQTNCVIDLADIGLCKWAMVGNVVTLVFRFDTISITASVAGFSFVLPANIPRPTAQTYSTIIVYDNSGGVGVPCDCSIGTGGVITVNKASGALFTGGANGSYMRGQITWFAS